MSVDKFDKDIESLYQERKRSIHAPVISLEAASNNTKRRPIESLSIVLMGGFASFCVFAIINHFAFLAPKHIEPQQKSALYVDLIEVKNILNNDDVIVIPVPPKNTPQVSLPVLPENNFSVNAAPPVQATATEFVVLDSKKLELSAAVIDEDIETYSKPLYRVMPTYPKNEHYENGKVKLTYKVNDKGIVEQVDIVESTVNRSLEKAATKALLQWKYAPESNIQKEFHIVFQFNNQ